ncbi:MAG TPA: glycosyltransferase family 2 protein [Candidatus Thermoplasmatota archaeon]|nr:glycosyltransferase family 2 protein [Candidatus Thermoplasmatota archaeon]
MIPVLFTTFNRLEFTKQTLPILLQNTPEGEIIVIDNGSTDGTVEYLLQHPGNFKCIFNLKNTGISGAMNAFFEMTKDAEFVAKVDNDTLVPAGWLSDLARVLDQAHLDIVQAAHYFHSTIYKDWDELLLRRPSKKLENGNVVYAKIVGGSGIVLRREIIHEPLEDNGLYGWGNFQYKHREHRRAMFDGVWIDLLDMEDYNTYRTDIDTTYFLSTGRFEKYG